MPNGILENNQDDYRGDATTMITSCATTLGCTHPELRPAFLSTKYHDDDDHGHGTRYHHFDWEKYDDADHEDIGNGDDNVM